MWRSLLAIGLASSVGCSDAAPRVAGPDGGSASDGGVLVLAPAVAPTESHADPTPRVRYVGRVDRSDAAGPRLAWPGTRVIVRFRGASLKVHLNERDIYEGPSAYDVLVDGVLAPPRFVPADGEGTYEVASGLAAGEPHVVELFRRTEAMVGATQILGFEYPGGELLAPPAWPDRRVEFLGDSESTGYGIECGGPDEAFSGRTEDARKTFPATSAAAVAAEAHNLSFSGKGILRNDDADPEVFGSLYPRAIPLGPAAEAWAFGTWQPDVVWINLGANDWGPGLSGDRTPPDRDAFTAKYRDLVTLVRAKNPTAQVVCSVEGIVNDDYPAGWAALTNLRTILRGVVDGFRATRDTRVHYHELPRAGEADLTGCAYHPNAGWHERASASVSAKIREITGWRP